MKSHKPPSFPFPSPSPPNYVSASQRPWPVEHKHRGADRPSFIPGEMGCSWTAPGPSPLIRPFHKPHCRLLGLYTRPRDLWTRSSLYLSFSFSFVFSQRLCHALLWRGTDLDFLRQGLTFFQQQGWSLSSAILRTISIKNTQHTTYIHSMSVS